MATLKEYIKELVFEEFDKVLSLSDKRRKEFLKSWENDNPPKNQLNLKKKRLLEADAAAPPGTPPPPFDPNAPGGPPQPPGGDPNAPPGIDPLLGGMAPPGAPGVPGMGASPPSGPGDPGMSPDMPPPGDGSGAVPPDSPEAKAEQAPGDPIQNILATAQELVGDPKDPSSPPGDPLVIEKAIKGMIQSLFAEPEHAEGIIDALNKTKNPILASVAAQLQRWFDAGSPMEK